MREYQAFFLKSLKTAKNIIIELFQSKKEIGFLNKRMYAHARAYTREEKSLKITYRILEWIKNAYMFEKFK